MNIYIYIYTIVPWIWEINNSVRPSWRFRPEIQGQDPCSSQLGMHVMILSLIMCFFGGSQLPLLMFLILFCWSLLIIPPKNRSLHWMLGETPGISSSEWCGVIRLIQPSSNGLPTWSSWLFGRCWPIRSLFDDNKKNFQNMESFRFYTLPMARWIRICQASS